jgi:hypothetical protein
LTAADLAAGEAGTNDFPRRRQSNGEESDGYDEL